MPIIEVFVVLNTFFMSWVTGKPGFCAGSGLLSVSRLWCQLLLVSIADSCYSVWVVLVLTNPFTIHISAYFNFDGVWDMISWCSMFLWWAFTSLFFSFSGAEVTESLFSSAAWGFSLQRAGSNMFAERKDTAEDYLRKSNLKLKQFEREKRFWHWYVKTCAISESR